MLKNPLQSLLVTGRRLIRQWQALVIFAALYILLLATLYGFIATREATVWQVLMTLMFAAAAPFLFFLLQAVIIRQARDGRIEWYRSLKYSCRLAVLALPVIAVGLVLLWLTNRWQVHLSPLTQVSGALWETTSQLPAQSPASPRIIWPAVGFATLRTILFGLVLPLALIHLWLETADQKLLVWSSDGFHDWRRKARRALAHAFTPESIVIYSTGLMLFGGLPYFLLFLRLPLEGAWSEMAVFSLRLGLALLFSLLGWALTLSTFARPRGNTVGASLLGRPSAADQEVLLQSNTDQDVNCSKFQ